MSNVQSIDNPVRTTPTHLAGHPVIDAVATHAAHRPNALAMVDLERETEWTYAKLDHDIECIGAWLVGQLGPASGRRVASLARNSGWLLILQLACVRAGAIYVPLNWRLAPAEIDQLIADCEPALLVRDPEFLSASDYCAFVELDRLSSLAAGARVSVPSDARRPADEPSTLLYTSGTSGAPKGVIVTESNAFWNCVNFITGNDVTIRSVFLADMPMFHTAGLFAAIRVPIQAGGTVLISQGFDPEKTLLRLGDDKLAVTHYFSVPQMAQRLWQQPGFDPAILRRLTVYAMGGAPNPAAQIERFVRAGIPMSDGFGMSESGSTFGMPFVDPDLLLAKAGSCGLPYLSMKARIVDDEGRDVPDGERGELWLSGPSVTPGYWNRPELTAKAFEDGWFKTADVALRDKDGFYFIVDRKKDMFISGGENVYPAEVEAVLAGLDEIAESAVIGIADPTWGEVGQAFVILARGKAIGEAAITQYCRERLAGFKVPKRVSFVTEIPRTSSGKILKHLLGE